MVKDKKQLTLKEFVESFITPNSLLRLWYPIEHGYKMIIENNDKQTFMGWELLQNKCYQSRFNDCKFIGVTDIICSSDCEAINLVIDYSEFKEE